MRLVAKILREKWQASIRTKLVTLFTLLVAAIASFVMAYFPYRQEQDEFKSMREKGQNIAEVAAYNIAPALYFDDIDAVKETFKSIEQLEDVTYIVVVDRSGRVIASYKGNKAREANFIDVSGEGRISKKRSVFKLMTPIVLDGEEIGRLYMGLSLAKLKEGARRTRLTVLIIGFLIMVLGFAAVTIISSTITEPLNKIVRTAKEIAAGDLSKRAPVLSRDEIGYLAETFNQMVDNLQKAQGELQKINRNLEKLVDERTRNLQLEVRRRLKAQKALEERLGYESLIATISSRFINLSNEEIDSGIQESLRQLGQFVGADRCYVVLLSEDGKEKKCIYGWQAKGVKPRVGDKQFFLTAKCPWWRQKIENAECLCIRTLSDLPPEADGLKSCLRKRGIKSVILLPLVYGRTLIGFLGFDAIREERRWPEDMVTFLKVVGEIIANAIGRKQTYEELKTSYEKVKRSVISTINAMSKIIELRDPYTAGHQQRVAMLASAIAREMGLPEERVVGIQLAALIHDIGKIYVPADILAKPGKLTEIEFDMIKTHPELGYNTLKILEFPWPIAEIIRQHHERLDGSGYPHGLKGDEILLEARIIGVADVIEAMASHRPYRPALGIEAALEEITRNSGKLYDPEVVKACVRLFREKGFDFEKEPQLLSSLHL